MESPGMSSLFRPAGCIRYLGSCSPSNRMFVTPANSSLPPQTDGNTDSTLTEMEQKTKLDSPVSPRQNTVSLTLGQTKQSR